MALFRSHISAGITLDQSKVLTAYPAPDWKLSLALRGPDSIDLTAQAMGISHRFLVSAAATADWLPGVYWYSLRATHADKSVYEVESGEVTIRADLAAVDGAYDGRNHAQRVLESIEAVLEKRATLDQERYKINNRELYRTPIADLLKLRDRYRAEVRRSKAAKNGELFSQAVRVRFR